MSKSLCPTDAVADIDRRSVDDVRIVRLEGELDTAVRESVTRCLVDGEHRNVVADLAGVTFMDCGGYRAFVDAARVLDDRSASMTIVNAVGQPARLLGLVHSANRFP